MRIVHVTDRLRDRGGAYRHLLSLMRAQARGGHDLHLAAGVSDGLTEAVEARVHHVPGLESRTAAPVDLGAALHRLSPDAVHVHTVVNPLALRQAADRGAVFTVQDHRLFCPARGKWTAAGGVCTVPMSRRDCRPCFTDEPYFEEMIGLTEARRDAIRGARVVVLSDYMRRELVSAGIPPATVHVVPPFVDLAPPPPPRRRDFVLFAGRLVAAKGALDAVEAWRRSGLASPLVVAGTGPLRTRMEAAGAEVLGWVPHVEMPGLLGRARALLMPSRWQEPFGIVGLEALSAGVPVVAWDSGGIGEWHPGPLVAWGDVQGLARALRHAVEAPCPTPRTVAPEVLLQRLDAVYVEARLAA